MINLRQRYEVWMDAQRRQHAMPYDLRVKTVNGRSYLYDIHDRGGNGKSLGPHDAQSEVSLTAYRQEKAEIKARIALSGDALAESAAMARALRLPLMASEAGPILREADRRSLLGNDLLVVGTNAMAAYALEAGGAIANLPDETQDFDLAWTASEPHADEQRVWDMLKAVDPTFTINTERTFQARNAKAYEVELLVAPSRAATMACIDRPQPVPLPEQEWLLLGTPVDQVVVCRDGSPARIVAPDPRWFALQKLWMSDQAKRSALKRPKDRKQALLLLDAIAEAMPHYRVDADFEAQLPGELAPYFDQWTSRRPSAMPRSW